MYYSGKEPDLSGRIHTHFEHCNLRILIKFQYRKGKSVGVVVVFLVPAGLILGGSHIVHQVSCAGLAYASGHSYLFYERKQAQVICCQILKGFGRVFYQDQSHVAVWRHFRLIGYGCG